MDEHALFDQTAIVTGASRGIGKEIARRCVTNGAATVICSRSGDRIETAAAEIEQTIGTDNAGTVHPIACDVTSESAVRGLVDEVLAEFDGVDVLINNAGGSRGSDGRIHTVDNRTWKENLAVNLTGPYLCSREVIPAMAAGDGGSIVHVSSANATTGMGASAYSAAKAGLYALSRTIAVHYGAFDIRSNVLSLGTIMTETRQDRMDNPPTETHHALLDEYPLGRFGWPDEVADAALFLASDRSSFITGVDLPIDGGLTAGLSQTLHREIDDIEEQPQRSDVR